MQTLIIGGIKDGERIEAHGGYFTCVEAPSFRFGAAEPPSFITHTYRLLRIGITQVFIHESLTDEQALERLIKRYRKTYKKKKWKPFGM